MPLRKEVRWSHTAATMSEWRLCGFISLQMRRKRRLWASMGQRSKSSCEPRRWKGKRMLLCAVFLAEQLNISERAIVLERGKKSRDKVIRIDGLSDEAALRRLLPTTNWK